MPKIKTVRDVEVAGKRVLVRVDFNVPLDENGEISDDTRIRASLPTIRYLLERDARVVLASHLGRPKGKRLPKFSLAPVGAALSQLLAHPVIFLEDCVGKVVEEAVENMAIGSIVLLENLRFHKGEEENDREFGQSLGKLGEIYVNDAFGTAHRAHASTRGVTAHIPVRVGGLLIERELHFLGEKTTNPRRPFVVMLGGAKVSDKILVVDSLLDKADTILVGGAMAYTFLLARGQSVGNSPAESDKVELARAVMDKARECGVKFHLPIDFVVTDMIDFRTGRVGETATVMGDIPDNWEGADIGPKTVEQYEREIAIARTILWNGPMGIFELDSFSRGTFALAKAVAANAAALSIIGGGDSVKAIRAAGYEDRVTFASTGGGASLEFLKGTELPGVSVLDTVE